MSEALAVILGAGPVGMAVGKVFRERGIRVRFVTRSGMVEGQDAVASDAGDAEALGRAAEGASLLVHAVGVGYQHWAAVLPPLQASVLKAAERTGATAVFAENLYSYDASTMPLTVGTSETPATRKGALRLELSRQWLDAHQAGRVHAVSVRASDYWGPGATRSPNSHFGSRFFPGLEAGKTVPFLGDPDAPHSYTYLPDYARALVDLSLDSTAWGRPWIAPSLAPTTARTVAEAFAALAGVKPKIGRYPRSVLRALGLFDPLIREVVEMLYQFEQEFTVDSTEFETRFGWKAPTLEQAVNETWAAHRAGR